MAKAKGIVHIEGSIDDFVFYTLKGERCVRRKDKKQGERIKNDANFERIRENNNEFGHCSGSGKLLRQGLASLVVKAKDDRLVSRMQRILSNIKDLDTVSVRGQRKVYEGLKTVEGKQLLKGFDFNVNTSLNKVLRTKWELAPEDNILHFPDFSPNQQLVFPEGATHARMVLAVTRVDFETGIYATAYSPEMSVAKATTSVDLVLSTEHLPESNGFVFYVLAVSFFQETGGELYSLKNEGCNLLHVLEVI
ncbi:MAG TPA: hypothetical protein VJL37_11515 [Flavobacterium sp.]|nr:hypothetical protein [Flavobacterium sp.]